MKRKRTGESYLLALHSDVRSWQTFLCIATGQIEVQVLRAAMITGHFLTGQDAMSGKIVGPILSRDYSKKGMKCPTTSISEVVMRCCAWVNSEEDFCTSIAKYEHRYGHGFVVAYCPAHEEIRGKGLNTPVCIDPEESFDIDIEE